MNHVINLTALKEALDSGMSSATIHNWVDDAIEALEYNKRQAQDLGEPNPTYEKYIVITKASLDNIYNIYDEVKKKLIQLYFHQCPSCRHKNEMLFHSK